MSARISGIGMTSQRTRMRMIERLREQGIADEAVLNVMNEVPRHILSKMRWQAARTKTSRCHSVSARLSLNRTSLRA